MIDTLIDDILMTHIENRLQKHKWYEK